jgi:SAM-dependent methyltransferase
MVPDFVHIRKDILSRSWPLDDEITSTAATIDSHRFLQNPAGQYAYIYLTQYLKAVSEKHFGVPFDQIDILDWGCGKGHVSKLLGDLGPRRLESCDIERQSDDSAFGQEAPILKRFQIPVTPLLHTSDLPYADATFDVIVSFGVLEHVANDAASIAEITRILKPGGLFFCFYLPTKYSWTQKIAHMRGNDYHDRLYTRASIDALTQPVKLEVCDVWYRQVFPKNTVAYPAFRVFEQIDQLLTRYTPLRYIATNIEFVAMKPR